MQAENRRTYSKREKPEQTGSSNPLCSSNESVRPPDSFAIPRWSSSSILCVMDGDWRGSRIQRSPGAAATALRDATFAPVTQPIHCGFSVVPSKFLVVSNSSYLPFGGVAGSFGENRRDLIALIGRKLRAVFSA